MFKTTLRFGSHFFYFKHFKDEDAVVVDGVNSKIADGKFKSDWHEHHILMIDYDDNYSYDSLQNELMRLQRKFHLGDAHVFESSFNRYFVFFFYEDMDYFDALRVLHDTKCCPNFKKYRMMRQAMTLRMSAKGSGKIPSFVDVVKSCFRKRMSRGQKSIYDYVMVCCDGKEE